MTWIIRFTLCWVCWSSVGIAGQPPSRDNAVSRDEVSARIDAALGCARSRFASEVKNGYLKGFDDERAQVAFKSTEKTESAHRPGMMEDDVIASTLRTHIAEDAAFRKLGLKVRSDSGRVQLTGQPGDPDTLARLIVLALEIDGVSGVRADLPPVLRAKS